VHEHANQRAAGGATRQHGLRDRLSPRPRARSVRSARA
jgi:hypothetical protein